MDGGEIEDTTMNVNAYIVHEFSRSQGNVGVGMLPSPAEISRDRNQEGNLRVSAFAGGVLLTELSE